MDTSGKYSALESNLFTFTYLSYVSSLKSNEERWLGLINGIMNLILLFLNQHQPKFHPTLPSSVIPAPWNSQDLK